MLWLPNGGVTVAECPMPGIYPDVPFDEYLSWEAVSNSSLNAAKRSMLHYKYRSIVEETPAMRLGTLCHAGKFEPLTIAQRYVVMPRFEDQVRRPDGTMYDNPKSSKAYKELVTDFKTANSDKIVVEQAEYDAMLGVVRALSSNSQASEYLAVGPHTKVEVAIIWNDEETGLPCKGRADAIQYDIEIIGDLKTTKDASKFENVIADRSYHRQGAFYIDGYEAVTGDLFGFAIAGVENSAPFGVRAAPLSDAALEVGREEYRTLLRQIADCQKSKSWPGYESPDEWDLPAWAMPSNVDEGKDISEWLRQAQVQQLQ